ncbi:hypothetical protein EPH05_01960 [Ureaplasma urealyticum]|uniref:hypothetical protein n=2 Tax=Ureaplasma urealyticum TaxID=2130 RepID=UPI001153CC8D|nr:hypothetical protein [Ureaplasma urealyticum]QDI63746.1 hypothetical protein EPH05_01960 [Ureaplasma urealyticum]UNT65976.1 hypothetical protein IF687_01930 [Ureaplasma urealyticum]
MKEYINRRILWLWILTTLWTIFLICSFFIKIGETSFVFFGKESEYTDKATLWDWMISKFPKLGSTKKWQLFLVVLFAYIICGCVDFFAISPFFWRFTTEGKNWHLKTRIEQDKLKSEWKTINEQKRSIKKAQNDLYKQNKESILNDEQQK